MPVSDNLQERILEIYQSNALATHLEHGCDEALAILSQLVFMNFNAETILRCCDDGDIKTIRAICKENLKGQSLANELYRELYKVRVN